MSTIQLKIVSAGLFFLFIFLCGYWLSRSGKPYGVLVFSIHKLIALGVAIYLVRTIYKVNQVSPLSPVQITAVMAIGLCFLATMITGGLLSIEKEMPASVHKLHQITPYLTVVATSVGLCLF
jgi:hypothetical protein